MTGGEFLAEELSKTQAALGTAILNRRRWDILREDHRMLGFLQERANAVDFQGVKVELQRIAEGRFTIPGIDGPRRKAEDCLRRWAGDLDQLR